MMIPKEFADAVERVFGRLDGPVPPWAVAIAMALLAAFMIFIAIRVDRKENQEDEPKEVEIPNPVAIKRQPAEIFETDCDLCGCGYRYTVDYVKDFTTVCPHCGTKNPHGPADTDIISRREPNE